MLYLQDQNIGSVQSEAEQGKHILVGGCHHEALLKGHQKVHAFGGPAGALNIQF